MADCDPAGRTIAARAWPLLDELTAAGTTPPPAILDLDGTPTVVWSHPAGTVGAAAIAAAAGEDRAADSLLGLAERQATDEPGYFAAAMVALGRIGLETDQLGACI